MKVYMEHGKLRKSIPSNITKTLSTSTGHASIFFCWTRINIDSNKISVSIKTISNPTITEGTITSSEFYSKYNDTLANIGISGDNVKYVHISTGSQLCRYFYCR